MRRFDKVCSINSNRSTSVSLFNSIWNISELRRRQLLICDSSTSEEEINAFAKKIFSPSHPTNGVYCVINSMNMPHEMRTYLTHALLRASEIKYEKSTVKVFILVLDNLNHRDELSLPIQIFKPMETSNIHELFRNTRKIFVYSGLCGTGKTELIKADANSNNKRILTIPIGDTIT